MRTRLVFGVATIAMAWPAAAHAADYGGGTAPESLSRSSRQLTMVGIRTTDDGRARITLMVSARCGFGAVRNTVALNPDGTFGNGFAAASDSISSGSLRVNINVPAPAGAGVLAMAGLIAARRRRA